jgi:hypothetical protein
MDLLSEIERKMPTLVEHGAAEGVRSVVRHIRAAERYLLRGREDNDEELFNDVIYRTNQAFEGILKEAYAVIANKGGNKLSPHQIEEYFLKQQVLTSRVMDLFRNYRQQWRNPSTHDHRLIFSEQEALLAIVSISAFTNILLDQIIEVASFKREQEKAAKRREQIQEVLRTHPTSSFAERLLLLLNEFSDELEGVADLNQATSEVELIGRLSGFIDSVDPSSEVARDVAFRFGDLTARPDLVLRRQAETLVIEVKRPGLGKRGLASAVHQVLDYLAASGATEGIVYCPPAHAGQRMYTTTTEFNLRDTVLKVHTVSPEPFGETGQ